MPSVENARKLLGGLARCNVNFIASLPDASLAPFIREIENSDKVMHVALSREEEGVGVCTGAYFGGRRCALVMQNAGLLNSCNALTTTALQFNIPMLLLILYAGAHGDMAFPQLGQVTEPVLAALGIPFHFLEQIEDANDLIEGALIQAYNFKKPVAVLLSKKAL